MILLAVIVTRSTVASLQAKQGLPLGNQVVGWLVLSELLFLILCLGPFFDIAPALEMIGLLVLLSLGNSLSR